MGEDVGTGSLSVSDGALCFDDVPTALEGSPEASYYGLASGRLDLQNAPETSSSSDMSSASSAASPHPPTAGPGPGLGPRSELFAQALASEKQVPDELATHLVDLYFQWEQPWCQVVDEQLFRASWAGGGSGSGSDNGNGNGSGRYCSPLLLHCILAVGARYSDRLDVRSDPDDPNTAGRVFLETAEVLLHFELKWPSITTLQSLAILAILYVAIGSDASGWLHHGMAVRLALDMGLNLDPSMLAGSDRMPPAEAQLRRQIYWALYCTDKLWASYTGRVCTMLDSQGVVNLPSVTVDPPPDAPPTGPHFADKAVMDLLHRALSTQCQILETILLNLYAPKRLTHDVQRSRFFDTCVLTLKGWYYALPRQLKIDDGQGSIPHVYVLHMVHHTSMILLAKPFLSKAGGAGRAGGAGEPHPGPGQDPSHDLAKRAAALCLEAARDICVLGDRYRRVFGSFRRSPLTATHCTLSAALVTLHAAGPSLSPSSSSSCSPRTGGGRRVRHAAADCVESCITTLQQLSVSWSPPGRYWPSIRRMMEERQEGTSRRTGQKIEEEEEETNRRGQGVEEEERTSPGRQGEEAGNVHKDRHDPHEDGGDNDEAGPLLQAGTAALPLRADAMDLPGLDFMQDDQLMLLEMPEMPFWPGLQPDLGSESLPWDYGSYEALGRFM